MLAAAALVPETALLVPGAAGRAEVLPDVRAAALEAISAVVDAGPDRVVVVVPSTADGDVLRPGPLRPTLSGAGIDDDVLGWPAGWTSGGRGSPDHVVGDVGASVALFLLGAVGWSGEVELLAASSCDARRLRALGDRLTDRPQRVALVLPGSLSARRGPDGPLPDDPRAQAFDDAVLADLADFGPAARGRLAAVPAELAQALAVSAWLPWQVLLGASPDGTRGHALWAGAPLGATYAVLSWTVGHR